MSGYAVRKDHKMMLSIVISAYNVEKYIDRTLSSLLDQTVSQFEIIVVNDGSTDDTQMVVQRVLQGRSEGAYKIISKENGGVSSARNRGLAESSGEYVLFLDGDDYVASHFVESIYALIDHQKPDVLCWGYDMVDENSMVLEEYFKKYKLLQQTMDGLEALNHLFRTRTMWICTGSAAFRKVFLDKFKLCYSEGCSNGEDQEFAIKVLSRAGSVAFLNDVLEFYVQRKGSVNCSYHIKKFDVISALKRACSDLRDSLNVELIQMAELIETQDMAENYFNTLDSCMIKSDIRPLLKEMDEKYPGLNQEITKAIRSYNGEKNRIRMKCVLYRISPQLYAKSVFLIRKIKGLESG